LADVYENAPLNEAVCEFRFDPGEPWDATIPGRVYTLLQGQFPVRRASVDFAAALIAGPEGIRQQVTPLEKTHFVREDETALIQVGMNMLSVNHLAPYPGWMVFRKMINEALRAYVDVAQPRGVHRIGLRYVNRIDLPSELPVDMRDYFHFYPNIGDRLPHEHGNFQMSMDFPFHESRDTMRVQLIAGSSDSPSIPAFVLDLDYYLNLPGAVPIETADMWIDEAHGQVKAAFEGAITDRLRESFDQRGHRP
jgi:uncharacterized protein (TIGR04255 family)